MGVTIETRYNPFEGQNIVVVTGSTFKEKLYSDVGIQVERDPHKKHHVGKGEERHDIENGFGVVVRRRVLDVPYPVLVAEAKAKELTLHFKPNGHNHVVADSTWEIMSPEGHVLSFNKPGGEKTKIEQILTALNEHRGQRISSDTGIGVIAHDLSEIKLFHATLMLGEINPNLDMGQIEQIVKKNPDTAGGFSVMDALSSGLILSDPVLHFRIRAINKTGAPFVGGRIMRFNEQYHELSADSVNNEWIRRLAVGAFPRK